MRQIKRIEANYNQAIDQIKNLDTQIVERQAKHRALLSTCDQLSSEPISTFQPTQWTALIDYAIVDTESIEFIFRTGNTIRISI